MTFQSSPNPITWRLHLYATPEQVYDLLASNDGRAQFWAESAMELDKHVHYVFPDGQIWRGKILDAQPGKLFQVEYYGGSKVTFRLSSDGKAGTLLELTDEGVPEADRVEVIAGWVSVLMALKAAVDFGVDLRNHDDKFTWDKGFVDN